MTKHVVDLEEVREHLELLFAKWEHPGAIAASRALTITTLIARLATVIEETT